MQNSPLSADKIMKEENIPTPYYIVYENQLRRNLALITGVASRSGAKIIMAFKANALWRTFDIFKEYGVECTASSVNELMLGREYSMKAEKSERDVAADRLKEALSEIEKKLSSLTRTRADADEKRRLMESLASDRKSVV